MNATSRSAPSAIAYEKRLFDRDGKERVPAGKVISDADLWKMDWYIPGVITQKK